MIFSLTSHGAGLVQASHLRRSAVSTILHMSSPPLTTFTHLLVVHAALAGTGWCQDEQKKENNSGSGEWRSFSGFVGFRLSLTQEGTEVKGEGAQSSCTVQKASFSIDGNIREEKLVIPFSFNGDKSSKSYAVGRTPKGNHLYLKDIQDGTHLFKTEFLKKYGLLPEEDSSKPAPIPEGANGKQYQGPRPIITVRSYGRITRSFYTNNFPL
jgi:hypothetical protein